MGCLNSIFQVWSDKGFVQGEKNTGVRAAKDRFKKSSILQALLAELTAFSSALSLVFKMIPRSLLAETVGRVWVLGELWDGRV